METTAELDYTEALNWLGLRFASDKAFCVAGGWTGLETRVVRGRLLVSQVRRETPGWHAGFNVDDEILAIDDDRVLPDQWKARLKQYQSGNRVSVLIARRDRLRQLDIVLESEPPNVWKLEPHPDAGDAQLARRAAWLAVRLCRFLPEGQVRLSPSSKCRGMAPFRRDEFCRAIREAPTGPSSR